MLLPFLVIQHEEGCPVGWLGDAWRRADVDLDIRTPYRATPGAGLPEDLSGHAALVVLGGSMNAYSDETHPWLSQTKALLAEAVERDAPTLATCLGHQLLAVAVGGEVRSNPHGRLNGRVRLGLSERGQRDPLLERLPGEHVVHMNTDIVTEIPSGATLLAHAPDGSLQAVRYARRVWGVQFHPEVTPETLGQWVVESSTEHPETDPDEILADVREHHADLRALADVMAERFLAVCSPSAA